MITERLEDLLKPSINALGYELVTIELTGSGGGEILRIYIDQAAGITVDDCAKVSRQVSAVLEVEDPRAGAYTLEVSSPGLDRPLVKPDDFKRYVGEVIKVRIFEPVLGRKNFTGKLVSVVDEFVVVEVDNEQYELSFQNIDKARCVPDFS
jgi:ribosome maturation factor RimP